MSENEAGIRVLYRNEQFQLRLKPAPACLNLKKGNIHETSPSDMTNASFPGG